MDAQGCGDTNRELREMDKVQQEEGQTPPRADSLHLCGPSGGVAARQGVLSMRAEEDTCAAPGQRPDVGPETKGERQTSL